MILRLLKLLLTGAVITITGCGGGGGGGGPAAAGTTSVSGVAMKGPINGADVKVFAVKADGTVDRSTVLGTNKTGADGSYSVTLSSTTTGPVVVEVTANAGSTYADEATQASSVPFKATLRTVVPSVTGGAAIAVTPLTEMAYKKAEAAPGGFSSANITAANQGVGTIFGVSDIVASRPFDPTKAEPAGATDDQRKYAAALGAFSQMVTDKRGTANVEDALVSVLTEVGSEMAGGGISGDTLAAVINAADKFKAANPTAPQPAITKPAAGVLRLLTAGALPAGILIGGIDVTVELPAGVTVKAPAGLPGTPQVPDAGVVTVSGEAAKAGGITISLASFTPASGATPAIIKFVIGSVNAAAGAVSGFAPGEFVSINCDVAPSATFPATADFRIRTISVFDSSNAATSLTTVQGATAFNASF